MLYLLFLVWTEPLLSYIHYSYWMDWVLGLFWCMFCLFSCSVWVQNRGFKTMRSKTRRLESGFEGPVEAENYTPVFMKVSKAWHWQNINIEIQQVVIVWLFSVLFRASWRKSKTQGVLNSYWNRITCQNLTRMLLRLASQRASWRLRHWHRGLKVIS